MQYNIKTIDRNGNITSEDRGDGKREKEDRPFRKKNDRQPGRKQQDPKAQGKPDQQPGQDHGGRQPGKGRQGRRNQQNQQPGQDHGDRQPGKGQRDQQGRRDQQPPVEPQTQQSGKDKEKDKERGSAVPKSRKNGPSRQKKAGSQKIKDVYDRDTRIWIQYQHYGTDDLSATVTFEKEQDGYRLSKVTITSVGGKLMDLWHVPTYTEGLETLIDPEEFTDLAMKLRISKKLHREAAPAVDETFVCVCDNETDYVMFPGGCPDNDELSGQAERFLNELGLKVARLCNPQEAMKNYGYV